MKNKEKDDVYYEELKGKTEVQIKECGSEILKLKHELSEQQRLRK